MRRSTVPGSDEEAPSLTLPRCRRWQQGREPVPAAFVGPLPCEHFRERGRVSEEAREEGRRYR